MESGILMIVIVVMGIFYPAYTAWISLVEAPVYLKTVSYTHLDVYKRQDSGCDGSPESGGLPAGGRIRDEY